MGEDDIEHIEAAGVKVEGVPQWAGYLVIVALFLGYLVKTNERDDVVATQRIERCHSIQTESNEIMKELTSALVLHSRVCSEMADRHELILRRLEVIDKKLGER